MKTSFSSARARCLVCEWATGDGTSSAAVDREAAAHHDETGHETRAEHVRWSHFSADRHAPEFGR